MLYRFEWDTKKAATNLQKHGVSFDLATEVFRDPLALTWFDEGESSDEEDRWITLGQVRGQHYLVVVHTHQGTSNDTVTVRIISARPATKYEIQQYESGD